MGLIRFLLACGVVLGHASGIFGYTPLSSNLAVQCFYIISGFYMALVLNEVYTGQNSVAVFYANRALKIYPLYWLVLILKVVWVIVALKLCFPDILDNYFKNWPLPFGTMVFLILTNILIIGLDSYFFLGMKPNGSLYFTSDAMTQSNKVFNLSFNIIAWTISLELIFYLFAPVITKKRTFIIVIILIVSLLIRILLAAKGFSAEPWNYMFLPSQVTFFMAGILSYRLYVFLGTQKFNNRAVSAGLFIYLIFVILLYHQLFNESYLKQVVLFTSFTLCVPVIFNLTKSFKFDRWLGNLSYPIYISQTLFLNPMRAKVVPKIFGLGFTTLITIIVFSILLDSLVTKPIERLRRKRKEALKSASESQFATITS